MIDRRRLFKFVGVLSVLGAIPYARSLGSGHKTPEENPLFKPNALREGWRIVAVLGPNLYLGIRLPEDPNRPNYVEPLYL